MARASSHPGCYRKAERALKTAQRRVARRKKGSNRRRKAVKLLAKAHQKVRRQRQDFHHKTALALVRPYDTIYHEDLQVRQHGQEPPPRQEHRRCGVGAFLSILAFKAAYAGKRVVAVPPAYTSQTCSGCGVVVAEGLVRPLACVPGVRNEPASGPQRREEHREAGQGLRGGVA